MRRCWQGMRGRVKLLPGSKGSGLGLALALLVAILLFGPPGSAWAEAGLLQQDTTVPAGQTVSDLVRVGGNVTIDGTVSDTVVVLDGDVTLRATADVQGMLILVGGQLHRDPGARTEDVVVHLSFTKPVLNGLLVGGGLVAGLWLLQLGLTLICILVPAVLVFALPERFAKFEREIRLEPGRLLGAGFLFGVLLLGLAVLLALTLVGLPLALIALAIAGAAFLLGLTAVSLTIAGTVRPLADRPPWAAAAVGAAAIAAGLNVPVLGGLLALGLFGVGLGLALFALRNWRTARALRRSGPIR